ncbi:MAG TPA: hypothetical protein VMU71_00985 [Terracidiphilus sp.]|nr:hypothetical protein [Terracidiphilus sp.]
MNCPSPILPLLARCVQAIPEAGDWIFEPRWDAFRVIVFRNGGEVLLQSSEEVAEVAYEHLQCRSPASS